MARTPVTEARVPGENGAADGPPRAEPVTPELVLVDPELARRARAQLPDRLESATRFGRREVAPPPPPAAWGPLFELAAQSEARAGRTPPRRRRRLALAVVSAVLVGGVVVGAALVVGDPIGRTNGGPAEPSREGPASAARTGARVPAASLDPRAKPDPPAPAAATGRRPAVAPRARAAQPAASRPRVFAWVPVVTATHYRVRFFEGGEVIFEDWPSKPRLKLPSEWAYRGRRHRLGPGRYSWEVRPGYGRRGRARYGNPIVRARLVV